MLTANVGRIRAVNLTPGGVKLTRVKFTAGFDCVKLTRLTGREVDGMERQVQLNGAVNFTTFQLDCVKLTTRRPRGTRA